MTNRFVLAAMFVLLQFGAQANEPDRRLELETGSSSVLQAVAVSRIAVGNSQIVQATALNGREVLLFGKAKGTTTVDLWTSAGKRTSYLVNVAPEGLKRIHTEIVALLKKIANTRSVIVGDKVVIEGENLSDADQARIAGLAARAMRRALAGSKGEALADAAKAAAGGGLAGAGQRVCRLAC